MLLFSQSPKRPYLTLSGNQLVASFSRIIASFTDVVRMYHAGCA